MIDEQIVALYWQRSECAIAETKTKYGNYCNSIAYNILECAEDAQECENDTYLAAWNAMPPHRPNLLSTFLGKLTRRIALDRWKSRRTQKRGGGTVTISTRRTDDSVEITVADTGIGFDPDNYMEDGKPHVGIRNVRERLHSMVGGSLTVASSEDGTVAVVTIPIKEVK
jgi:DNA-directed RNA polymerase specialized sigma24 family protein